MEEAGISLTDKLKKEALERCRESEIKKEYFPMTSQVELIGYNLLTGILSDESIRKESRE